MPAFEAPVYTLKGIKIRFGSKQLFEDVELYINRGDKISLVGRNGSGKSTLLKIIAGIIEPDDGEIFIQPNVKIGYMPQDADLSGFKTLREAVAAGLDKHDGSEDYKTDMWIEQLEIAADADPATAWAEGVSGAGEGEWLSLFFSEQKVAGFAIRAGYQRSADTYNANGRPADIRVSVAGESDCTVTLDDARGEQVVLFSYPVVTDYLSIEISSVYGGASNAYTCISDVRVLLAG